MKVISLYFFFVSFHVSYVTYMKKITKYIYPPSYIWLIILSALAQ